MPDMSPRVAALDIELAQSLTALRDLSPYTAVRALVRLHGVPVGSVELPVLGGQVAVEALSLAIRAQLRWPLLRQQLAAQLTDPGRSWPLAAAPDAPPRDHPGPWPSITVAVCTRNRPADLARCVDALCALDYPGALDILVVDNAPSDDSTEALVRARFPQARYVREPRPGLDWARNRAIAEATGEILAYTDDDVVVDRLWARAIARTFAENPGVMALTGLVVPLELETAAQLAFEQYGGFGRGFVQRWYGINRAAAERAAAEHMATGQYGTGANMAYRRTVFARIGGFDPALDVGTVTNGGGDLEMFFRVIKAGFPLVYEPRAIVRHRHRSDHQSFLSQIANNGVGFYAYLERSFLHFPDERFPVVRQGIWWFIYWYIYRLLLSFFRPVNTTRQAIRAELRGGLAGMRRYRRARQTARGLAQPGDLHCEIVAPGQEGPGLRPEAIAVRVVELGVPPQPIADVAAYPSTRVLVQIAGAPIGAVTLNNLYLPISVGRLYDAIIDQLGESLPAALSRAAESGLPETEPGRRPADASVVLVARDTPDALGACLQSLLAAGSPRLREIIVVDSAPASGLTAAVVARFPGVRYLRAPRDGGASALNCGLAQATGAVIVTLDERSSVPAGWLDRLLAPLSDPAVMAVVGDQQPAELETPAQAMAAQITRRAWRPASILGRDWLRSAPVSPLAWAIGGAGNAAFRAEIFADPGVGLFDEALGAAQLAGATDAYLCYKILRAGHQIAIEPGAYVWRSHGRTMAAGLAEIERATSARLALELTLLMAEGELGMAGRQLASAARRAPGRLAGRAAAALRGRSALVGPAALARLRGLLRAPEAMIAGRSRRRGPSAPPIAAGRPRTQTDGAEADGRPTHQDAPKAAHKTREPVK